MTNIQTENKFHERNTWTRKGQEEIYHAQTLNFQISETNEKEREQFPNQPERKLEELVTISL